jgi:hypothetical protein
MGASRKLRVRILCAALAAGFAGGASAVCTDEQKYGAALTPQGGPGGAPWSDKALAAYGEITKIEVWGGAYVDAIRVTYGNIAGPLHGGGGGMPGGSPQTITLAPGEFVTMIDGQVGKYVDNLCFTKNTQVRTCTGGGGGGVFQMASGGKAIRYFTGRSGSYVDQISASFENYAGVDPGSVRADPSAMQSALATAQDKVVTQTIVNSLDVPQQQVLDERQVVSSSSSSNWSNSSTLTQTHQVGGEFDYTPPLITGGAGGKVSYSYTNTQSSSNSQGGGTSDSTSQSYGVIVKVTVPPRTQVVATTTWKQASYSIPISYDLVYYSDWLKSQPVCRETTNSVLQGMQSFGVKTTFAAN